MVTPRKLKEITIHTLNRKVNMLIWLWAFAFLTFIMSQVLMLGNMNQSYQRLLSVIDVTSRVAENAVTDATASVAATAAVTSVMCQPLTPALQTITIPGKDRK